MKKNICWKCLYLFGKHDTFCPTNTIKGLNKLSQSVFGITIKEFDEIFNKHLKIDPKIYENI